MSDLPTISSPDCYVFLHIPKTGGTSIGFILDYAFNRRVFWRYDESYEIFSTETCSSLSSLIDEGLIKLVGGHITFAQCEDLRLSHSIKVIATIRHPFSHFISKINHDLNVRLSATPEFINAHYPQASRAELGDQNAKSPILIPQDTVKHLYSYHEALEDPAMANYLYFYLRGSSGMVNPDYVLPVEDLQRSIQYLFWKENITREDPAFYLRAGQSFPVLNEGSERRFLLALTDDELKEITSFLSISSFPTYDNLFTRYLESIEDAARHGFIYEHLPVSRIAL